MVIGAYGFAFARQYYIVIGGIRYLMHLTLMYQFLLMDDTKLLVLSICILQYVKYVDTHPMIEDRI